MASSGRVTKLESLSRKTSVLSLIYESKEETTGLM